MLLLCVTVGDLDVTRRRTWHGAARHGAAWRGTARRGTWLASSNEKARSLMHLAVQGLPYSIRQSGGLAYEIEDGHRPFRTRN